jgi:hypothetical protein
MAGNYEFKRYSFYPFARLNITDLSVSSIAHLEYTKALYLPSQLHLDEFVQKYFYFIHPFLPVIDEGWFWERYVGYVEQGTSLSLFILQAMLFMAAGVCLVNLLCTMAQAYS